MAENFRVELGDLAVEISEANGDLRGALDRRKETIRRAVKSGIKGYIVAEWAKVDPVVVSRALKDE